MARARIIDQFKGANFFQTRKKKQNSYRNNIDWDFIDAQPYDHQVTLLEELNKHIKLCLKTSHFKLLKVFEEEHNLEDIFLVDYKYWNIKNRNGSHDGIPCIGILDMTTTVFPIRNPILFISELSCHTSNNLGIPNRLQSKLSSLSSSHNSWLKSNASIGSLPMSWMSCENKIYSPSVTLNNSDLGSICGSSRLLINTDNHINSNHRSSYSESSSTCALHQKSTLKNENHFMRSHGLTSSSTYSMQPISSRWLPYRRSMVGSYEECLIHGRMSTTPSKTFFFFAEISVLGTNKCTTNLRCPTHIKIPFPAVFYSYESSDNQRNLGSEARQSPYVGLIDLEKGNPNHCSTQKTPLSRSGSRHSSKREYRKNEKKSSNCNTNQSSGYQNCHVIKSSLRSSKCLPPTGGYRIPKIGQVQIIIRNLNKTPVKVFLVPYNLSEMNPGTKTFIRQRSYLTKTFIEEPLRPNSNSSKTNSTNLQILHSLAHIQICSPSRNRFYLYKCIRLVFENRITDCGENLRMEVSLPEPRYSNYKPESIPSHNNFGS
ncbi:hypothetical protein EPUL_001116 [Erysiphe pulchra]|uniref:Atos-like conserved domain-containing protein n=1 Tax=Erysiphe pulchra TaxID=225359 RepID=A0A2S4PY73_9PEZI|nr:hypothetical protein EPUL_001116 [Erysiphe pulchra]